MNLSENGQIRNVELFRTGLSGPIFSCRFQETNAKKIQKRWAIPNHSKFFQIRKDYWKKMFQKPNSYEYR